MSNCHLQCLYLFQEDLTLRTDPNTATNYDHYDGMRHLGTDVITTCALDCETETDDMVG